MAEEGEYHDEALEAANADYLSEGIANLNLDSAKTAQDGEDDVFVAWTQEQLSKIAYVRADMA